MTAVRQVAPKVCRDCAGQGWLYLEPGDDQTDSKSPCPTCQPYGPRMPATSAHADGVRVEHRYTGRTGIVLRSWRKHQGAKRPDVYVYCDIRYDDERPGVAWENDLMAYDPEKW